MKVSRAQIFYQLPSKYEDLENLHIKKEFLIEKLNQNRQEQDRLYQYKKNYDSYLGKEVER